MTRVAVLEREQLSIHEAGLAERAAGDEKQCSCAEACVWILTMSCILRFSGAVERDPAIDVWLNQKPDELRSIAHKWFELMRECGDDVRELMHDGCPVACVGDAPFGYVNVFTSHVNVGFYNGAGLQDPGGLLEGTGKRMRHVKLRPASEVDSSALSALIAAAYLDMKTQLEIG
jgi:hypothetical protein